MNNLSPRITILGCGSAKPTLQRNPSAQVLQLRDKTFLIDCAEGTQLQLLRNKIGIASLHRIFISHLHGDHCLGLPGLLSTMALMGFDHPVHVYGPYGIREYVEYIVRFFCRPEDRERIVPHEISNKIEQKTIYEDRSITVTAFPLQHTIPTIGYLFREAPSLPHLNRAVADFYNVPIAYFGRIKQGADYTSPSGEVIPNHILTTPAPAPKSYAYCSDTAYLPSIVPIIKGVTLLYHEATFEASMRKRAAETNHSTTIDAAQIALNAGVGTLLIGHYSARYMSKEDIERLRQECISVFPNVLAAYDGLTLDLSTLSDPSK